MKKVRALLTGIVSLLLVITIFGCSADTNTPNRQVEEKRKLEIEIPDGNSDTMTISVPTGVNEVKYIIVGKGEEAPTAEEIMNLGTTYVPGTEINRPVNEDGSESDEEYTVYVVATTTTGNGQPAISGVVVSAPWKVPENPVIGDTTLDNTNHTAAIGGEGTTEGAKTKYLLVEYINGKTPVAPSAEEIWVNGKDYNGEEIDLEGSYYIYSVAKLGSRYSEVKCIPHIVLEAKFPEGDSDTMVINVPEPEDEGTTVETKYIKVKVGENAPTEEDVIKNGTTYDPNTGITRDEDDNEEYVIYVVTVTTGGDGQPAISGVVIPWVAPEVPENPEMDVKGQKIEIAEETEDAKVKYLLLDYVAGQNPVQPTAERIWAEGKEYTGELVLNKSYHIYYVSKLEKSNRYSEVKYKFFKWVDVSIPTNSDTATFDVPQSAEVRYVLVEKGKDAPSTEDMWNNGTPYTPNTSVSRPDDGKEYEVYIVTKDKENPETPPAVSQTITWKAPVAPVAPQIVVDGNAHTYRINGRTDGAVVKYLLKDYSRTNTVTAPSVAEIWANGTVSNSVTNISVANSKYVYAVAKLGSKYSTVASALVPYKLTVSVDKYNVANRTISFTSNVAATLYGSDTKNGSYTSFGNTGNPSRSIGMVPSTGAKTKYIKVCLEGYQDSDPITVDNGLYVGRRFSYVNNETAGADGKTYNMIIFSAPSSGKVLAVDETPLNGQVTWGGGETLFTGFEDLIGKSGLELTQFIMKYKDTSLTNNYPQTGKYDNYSTTSIGSMWTLLATRAGYTFNGSAYTGKWFIPSLAEATIIKTLLESGNANFSTLKTNIMNSFYKNTNTGVYTCWTSTPYSGSQAKSYSESVSLSLDTVSKAIVFATNYRKNSYGALACFAF